MSATEAPPSATDEAYEAAKAEVVAALVTFLHAADAAGKTQMQIQTEFLAAFAQAAQAVA